MAEVTEHWNPWVKQRKDLFGVVDILGLSPEGETIAVQATSYSNVSARVKKIADCPALPYLRKCGWKIVVFGWRKVNNRWTLREVDCS